MKKLLLLLGMAVLFQFASAQKQIIFVHKHHYQGAFYNCLIDVNNQFACSTKSGQYAVYNYTGTEKEIHLRSYGKNGMVDESFCDFTMDDEQTTYYVLVKVKVGFVSGSYTMSLIGQDEAERIMRKCKQVQ